MTDCWKKGADLGVRSRNLSGVRETFQDQLHSRTRNPSSSTASSSLTRSSYSFPASPYLSVHLRKLSQISLFTLDLSVRLNREYHRDCPLNINREPRNSITSRMRGGTMEQTIGREGRGRCSFDKDNGARKGYRCDAENNLNNVRKRWNPVGEG